MTLSYLKISCKVTHKMSICFVGSARYHQPLDQTSVKKFEALEGLGEIFVIGFSESIRPQRFSQHARFFLLPRLPLAVLRYAEMFMLGPLIALWLIVRNGVEVLVAQGPHEGVAAALAKKIARCFGYRPILVVENHGDFEESVFMQRRIILPELYRILMRYAAGFSLRNADVLRAVSHSTNEQLARWSPGKPIAQFPTWTDIEVFLEASNNRDEATTQNILYAGMLIPRKGIHHLVNAFAAIAGDFPLGRLIIVGRAENKAYASELKTQIKEQGLEGHVQLVPEVSQIKLAAWMQQACVFVLPTYSEGLPRVIFEAMAAGIPVIATAVSGIPEVLEDGFVGFLIPPGDETALADRLRYALEHPGETHEMGRHARAFAEHFFSTEAYVQGYRRIFEDSQALLNK
jgi:glycosyltransferase involved in cell wall biosynthesis